MEMDSKTQEKAAQDFRSKAIAEKAGLTGGLAEFARLEEPYTVQVSQAQGEKALAGLASTVQLEYIWIYNMATSEWNYEPIDTSNGVIDYQEGSISHNVKIPEHLHYPESNSSIFYHIHPMSDVKAVAEGLRDNPVAEEFLAVTSQLPKRDDLQAVCALMKNGYKGFKFVTPLGITSLVFNEEKLSVGGDTFSFTIKEGQIKEKISEGVEEAIEYCVRFMNDSMNGVIEVNFTSFKED